MFRASGRSNRHFIPLSAVLGLSPEACLDHRLWHSKFSMRLFPQARMRNRRTMLLEWSRLAMTGSRSSGTRYLT
jgi:hypothetical protein